MYDLFVSWYDKRPEYVLYPSLSWIWNMSGSSKEAAFWWKNSHVTITWHAVVPCEHLYRRQVHAHHFSNRVWGALVGEDEIWDQFLFEPRLHVECRVIVSYLKEQVLVYHNQLSNLFCRMGWTNSLNKAFSENSSLTNDIDSIILSDFLSHGNYIWSYFKKKKWNHKMNVKPEIDDLDKFFKHSINCVITSSGYRDQTVNEGICLNF